jgi:hypothetical protein
MRSCATGRIACTRSRRIRIELKEVSELPLDRALFGLVDGKGAFARLLVEWKLAQVSASCADVRSA